MRRPRLSLGIIRAWPVLLLLLISGQVAHTDAADTRSACISYRVIAVDASHVHLVCQTRDRAHEVLRSVRIADGGIHRELPLQSQYLTGVDERSAINRGALRQELQPTSVRLADDSVLVQISPFTYHAIDLQTGTILRSLDIQRDSQGRFIRLIDRVNTLSISEKFLSAQYTVGSGHRLLTVNLANFDLLEQDLDTAYRYLALNPEGQISLRVLDRAGGVGTLEYFEGDYWHPVTELPERNFILLGDPSEPEGGLWIYSVSRTGVHTLHAFDEGKLNLVHGPTNQAFEVTLNGSGEILWIFASDASEPLILHKRLSEVLDREVYQDLAIRALRHPGPVDTQIVAEVVWSGSRQLVLIDLEAAVITSILEIE